MLAFISSYSGIPEYKKVRRARTPADLRILTRMDYALLSVSFSFSKALIRSLRLFSRLSLFSL